jgi:hypothetical protein
MWQVSLLNPNPNFFFFIGNLGSLTEEEPLKEVAERRNGPGW